MNKSNDHYSSLSELSPVTCPGQEPKQKYKNKKQEKHFSSVVTDYSSMVTFPRTKQEHLHGNFHGIYKVTCLGQRQQPRTSPRRDQFHLVNKCIISTKQ
jgi:hypothetical protein